MSQVRKEHVGRCHVPSFPKLDPPSFRYAPHSNIWGDEVALAEYCHLGNGLDMFCDKKTLQVCCVEPDAWSTPSPSDHQYTARCPKEKKDPNSADINDILRPDTTITGNFTALQKWLGVYDMQR